MRFIVPFFLSIFFGLSLSAQKVQVQFINNSSTTSNEEIQAVDVYLDEVKVADSLSYRSASSFLEFDSKSSYRIGFAQHPSDSSSQSFAVYNLGVFTDPGRFVALINGSFGNPENPFELFVQNEISEQADNLTSVAFRWINGTQNFDNINYQVQKTELTEVALENGILSEQQSLPAQTQIITLAGSVSSKPKYYYKADLRIFSGETIQIISSGSIGSEEDAGLFGVTASGDWVAFQEIEIPELLINEVDYEQPGADNTEFIELKNNGNEAIDLAGWAVELWNGSLNEAYGSIILPAVNLDAGAYFLICFGDELSNCDLKVNGSIQNGGTKPDALALIYQEAIADALNYEGTIPGYGEGPGDSLEDDNTPGLGLSRIPDGLDTDQNNQDFKLVCSTPGKANIDTLLCESPNLMDSVLVQFIHAASASDFDIYLNGSLWVSNLQVDQASSFQKFPAGEQDFSIVPAGGDISEAVYSSNLNLVTEKIYTIVIQGAVGAPEGLINIVINDQARTVGNQNFTVDFNFFNALTSTDQVDILIQKVGIVANDLGFQDFSVYNSALPAAYILELRPSDTTSVLATFELDLKSSSGQAITIVLKEDPSSNGNFTLLAVFPDGRVEVLPLVQFASVQLVHNVPNILVDIYTNGTLLVDNFAYRNASKFLEVRANNPTLIEIKPDDSSPASPSILSFENFVFEALSKNILFIGGDGTPEKPVNLFINRNAETKPDGANEVRLGFHHGATDINKISIENEGPAALLSDLSYGEFQSYLDFSPEQSRLALFSNDPDSSLGVFRLDLKNKVGQSGILFSSGVVSGSGTLGLFIAFADGSVQQLPALSFTRAQFLHNALPASAFDIYANDRLLVSGLNLREATPFLDVLAEETLEIAFAPAGSNSIDSAVARIPNIMFEKDRAYLLVASGSVGSDEFPFDLVEINEAQEELTMVEGIATAIFNGVPDWSSIDLLLSGTTSLSEGLSYRGFQDYKTLSPDAYILNVFEGGTDQLIGNFDFDIKDISGGDPMILVASGLVGASPDPVFLGVFPDGRVQVFPEVGFGKYQFINALSEQVVDLYIDGQLVQSNIGFREATPFLDLKTGVNHELKLVPTGESSDNALFSETGLSILAEEVWTFVAAGLAGDGERPIALFLNTNSALDAGGADKLAFNFFHGSQDASNIDIVLQNITTLHRDVAYGAFTDYTLLEPLSSDPLASFEIKLSNGSPVLATFRGDFRTFDNQAITIFATGNLINRVLPSFALWVALPDGTTQPLELVTGLPVFDKSIQNFTLYPNPVQNEVGLSFILSESKKLGLSIRDVNGKQVLNQTSNLFSKGEHKLEIELSNLTSGIYFVHIFSEEGIQVLKFVKQ